MYNCVCINTHKCIVTYVCTLLIPIHTHVDYNQLHIKTTNTPSTMHFIWKYRNNSMAEKVHLTLLIFFNWEIFQYPRFEVNLKMKGVNPDLTPLNRLSIFFTNPLPFEIWKSVNGLSRYECLNQVVLSSRLIKKGSLFWNLRQKIWIFKFEFCAHLVYPLT